MGRARREESRRAETIAEDVRAAREDQRAARALEARMYCDGLARRRQAERTMNFTLNMPVG